MGVIRTRSIILARMLTTLRFSRRRIGRPEVNRTVDVSNQGGNQFVNVRRRVAFTVSRTDRTASRGPIFTTIVIRLRERQLAETGRSTLSLGTHPFLGGTMDPP